MSDREEDEGSLSLLSLSLCTHPSLRRGRRVECRTPTAEKRANRVARSLFSSAASREPAPRLPVEPAAKPAPRPETGVSKKVSAGPSRHASASRASLSRPR